MSVRIQSVGHSPLQARCHAALVAVVLAFGPVVPDAARADLTPVWEAAVIDSDGAVRVRVILNEFERSRPPGGFPIAELPIRRVVNCSTIQGGRVSACFRVDMGILEVDSLGRIRSDPLSMIPAERVHVDSRTGRIAALYNAGIGETEADIPLSWRSRSVIVDFTPKWNERVLGWELAPDRSWVVIHTEQNTHVITPSGRISSLGSRTWDGMFTPDGSRYIAAVKERGVTWIFVDSTGVVRRLGSAGGDLHQLHLSPDARVLTFDRDGVPDGGCRAVDLGTGDERRLPAVPDGPRYHSADGKTALVGSGALLDTSDPWNPIVVASTPVEAPGAQDAHCITGAVSSGGSQVAVQCVVPEDESHSSLRVTWLNRALRQKAVILGHTKLTGVQFEGRYLLVGTQRGPAPAYFELTPTRGIRVYDLGEE